MLLNNPSIILIYQNRNFNLGRHGGRWFAPTQLNLCWRPAIMDEA